MVSAKKENPKLIVYDSYIKAIENSTGAKVFRNLFVRVNGKKEDVLKNGVLSCAFYVSSLLYLFKLISDIHATVDGTVIDLEKSGWAKINRPKKGAVLVWKSQKFGGSEEHKHIGFYINNKKAISNSSRRHQPILHHWTFGNKNGQPVWKVGQIFWHPKLDNN